MSTSGLVAVVLVLVIGTVVGLARRRTDGRLRRVGPTPATAASGPSRVAVTDPSGVVVSGLSGEPGSGPSGGVVAGPAAAAAPGDPRSASQAAAAMGERIDPDLLAALGVGPARATLLQFSTVFCAPCRALRRLSAEVAAMIPGVQHVEVDAESRLDAVRALDIWRTPTLLVLDADGRIVRRATGVPTKPHLIAALGEALPD